MTLEELEECDGVPKRHSCTPPTYPAAYPKLGSTPYPNNRPLYGRDEKPKLDNYPCGMPLWQNYQDVDD